MKKTYFFKVILLTITLLTQISFTVYAQNVSTDQLLANNNAPTAEQQQLLNNNKSKVSFTENKGQVKDQNWQPRPDVLYSGETQGMVFHIRNNGISYQLLKEEKSATPVKKEEHRTSDFNEIEEKTYSTYRVDINWLNANSNYSTEKGKALPGYNNYYNVPDGTEPALHVKNYENVTLKNVWNGVDLHYFEKDGILESDWLMQKAENYKNIKFEVKGATLSTDKEGYLIMKTPFGEIREGKLKVYQEEKELAANWVIQGNEVSFNIENYNKNLPLRIDPPTLVWGTYYGGTHDWDYGQYCSTDGNGNVYLAGKTQSTTNIATVGAHQTTSGVAVDAFLVQFNSSGVRQWGTYYGGSNSQDGFSCAADGNGNVYLSGYTQSTTNIATAGAYQTVHAGGTYDAYLVKFDINGVRQWGTYYGGGGTENYLTVATDGSGNVYLAGETSSGSSIATPGAHQAAYSGNTDLFLVKFDPNGVRQWGTYYGGTSGEFYGLCTTDASGNVYISGRTASSDYIATTGAHQTALTFAVGTSYDAFLVKFNASGVRQWGTYYGGNGIDFGRSCATDGNGNVYLSGETASTNNIATAGAHQTVFAGGTYDGYLVQFNSSGVRQWGTYYGGTGNDYSGYCATDASGNVSLAGGTWSNAGISTPGSHQTTRGGNADAYLVQFNSSGIRQWGTYYGGSSTEDVVSCSIDGSGNIYVAGTTSSTVNIATNGSHQANYGGGIRDAFLGKFQGIPCPAQPSAITGNTTLCAGAIETYSVTNDVNATSYTWTLPSGWSGTSTTNSITATAGTSGGTITVTANNACGSSTTQTLTITVNDVPVQPNTITGNTTLCEGTIETYSVTNDAAATSYTWTLPSGWSGTSTTNSITATTGTSGGSITVTANNACGSSTTQTLTVTVNPLPTVVATGTATICDGDATTLTATGASSYAWDNGAGTGASVSVSPTSTTTYTVTGTDANSCSNTDQVTVTVNPLPTVVYTQTPNLVCENDAPFALTGGSPSGGVYSGTGVSAGNFDPAVAGAGTHTITYSFTDGNNCSDTDTQQIQVDVCAGINEQANQLVTIYPNPFKNEFTVSFTTSGNHTIELFNILGEQIKLINVYEQNTVINTDDLPSGVYFLHIVDEKLIFKLLKN